VFGILSGIYRIFVFATILLFVADQFLLLGIIMAFICLISWVLVPIWKFISYLGSSPKLDRVRLRAISVSVLFFASIILVLSVVRFPYHFRAPGIVEASKWSQLTIESDGVVEELLAEPGAPIRKGQPLVRLSNRQLELQREAALANLKEIDTRIRMAVQAGGADLKPLKSSQVAANKRLAQIDTYLDSLVVKAGQDGLWVAPGVQNYKGRWLSRGTPLGLVVDPESFEFVAVVQQKDVDFLFDQTLSSTAEARFRGESEVEFGVNELSIIPGEQYNLPSAALGWAGGGPVPVKQGDGQGTSTTEPFFRVIGKVAESDSALLYHGRTGTIRFDIGSQPLIPRWIRRFRQLLQRRYQL